MAPGKKHIIRSIIYDTVVQQKENAKIVQDTVSRVHNSEIVDIIDSVFDSFSEEEIIYRFDTIELDLGVLRLSEYEQKLSSKIKEALQQFLSEISDEEASNNVRKEKTSNSDFNKLEFYLVHGYYSWNTDKMQSSDYLLKSVLSSNKEALKSFLIRFSKNDNVRKRLIFQFSEETMEQMLLQVAGKKGAEIIKNKNLYPSIEENRSAAKNVSNTKMLDALLIYLEESK